MGVADCERRVLVPFGRRAVVSFKSPRNGLLKKLSVSDLQQLEPMFQLVDLEVRTPLEISTEQALEFQ